MSRSGYTDDDENYAMWRGQVASAIRGKRGQQLLREMAQGMDAMVDKTLIAGDLEHDGAYCALGVVGALRGIDMSMVDEAEPQSIASAFNIARQLACEVAWINDEAVRDIWVTVDGKRAIVPETTAQRWIRVRQWVAENLQEPT